MVIPCSQQNKVYTWLVHIRASRADQGWISYFSVIIKFSSSNLDSQRGSCPLYWKFLGTESTVRSFLNAQGVDRSFPDNPEWKVIKMVPRGSVAVNSPIVKLILVTLSSNDCSSLVKPWLGLRDELVHYKNAKTWWKGEDQVRKEWVCPFWQMWALSMTYL